MAEKLAEAQKDIRGFIRDSISREEFHPGSYPNEYGGRFLEQHAVSLSFLFPDDVKLTFMQREFQVKDFPKVVEAIAARHADKGIQADWLARELADAYLIEKGITKPRS